MHNIIQIFNDLKKLNSVKDKEALLYSHKNIKELKELLQAGLDKDRLFQFNKMPSKYLKCDSPYDYSTAHVLFMNLLDKLENRIVTGNAAKSEVKTLFSKLDKDTYDLFSKILCKKALGISARTANKVWPNLVSEWQIMKTENKLPDLTSLGYPLYVQPKRDGYRCTFKDGKLYTSRGKPFKNKQLSKYFTCLERAGNYVLDGELYMHGKTLEEHTEILNSFDAELPSSLKFYIFDIVPLQNWCQQSYNRSYKDRLTDIRVVCNSLIAQPQKVIDVHTELVETPAEVSKLYKKYLTQGYEGAILRSTDGLYKWKRVTLKSGEMAKLKPMETVDVKVLEIFEGKDQFEGLAGGFTFITDSGVTSSVGTGFTLVERKAMAEEQDKYLGKTAEVAIFGRTKEGSYRDPRFKRWRPDKD